MSPAHASPLRRAYASVAVLAATSTVAIAASLWFEPPRVPLTIERVTLRIDPNRASAAELELLPRIGPTLAAAIIERRAQAATQPAFGSLGDLDAIRGIGPATLEQIAPHLVFPAKRQ